MTEQFSRTGTEINNYLSNSFILGRNLILMKIYKKKNFILKSVAQIPQHP